MNHDDEKQKEVEDYQTEIQRRIQEIRSGTANGIPVQEVLAELRNRVLT